MSAVMFHRNMTADNTRTGPTRLTKHSQWPSKEKKQLLGLYTYTCGCLAIYDILD